MNILFLTLLDFRSIEEHNIYTDLLREFTKHNHKVFVVSPVEKRAGGKTNVIRENNCVILKLKIGNIQKTNIIEKGISTITLERIIIRGIKKFYPSVKFDLIIYSTPPITLQKAVAYVKKRDNAKTYLLLKDIFPQNAVDMGMMSKKGFKSVLYNYFRNKEKKLYALSDHIGCMSQANCNYVINHNLEIETDSVEVCPNSIEVIDIRLKDSEKSIIRKKYEVPSDKIVFVYGGNLGRPQSIPFIIECLKSQVKNIRAYFLIIGDGTEFDKLESFFSIYKPTNMKLMQRIPKEDYDRMIAACDVGMIFLDNRFTIPNFPSRLLSYMQAGIPVLACTDVNTDVGSVIIDGNFGWWCESNNVKSFEGMIEDACKSNLKEMGMNGFNYLCENYSVAKSYRTIVDSVNL